MRDIRSLDLGLLRAFDALMDERSVTRAALRLSLTQPAVSGLLARLREVFDDSLFVRTLHGVVPTDRAHRLDASIKEILVGVQALLEPPRFEPAKSDQTFTIAATDYALSAVVVPLMAALRVRAPRVRVAVRPVDDSQVATQLERGELDFALLTPQTTPEHCHARPLFDEHYVCALRSNHPKAGRARTLSLAKLCSLEHVLVSLTGDQFLGATDLALAQLNRQRKVVLSVTSFMIVRELLISSDLAAVLPSRVAEGVPGLVTRRLPLEVPGFTKTLVWHERTYRTPAQCWFRDLVARTCNEVEAMVSADA